MERRGTRTDLSDHNGGGEGGITLKIESLLFQ